MYLQNQRVKKKGILLVLYLSNNLLKKGENEIKVTLNSNDHSHLMANGMPLTFEIELMADGKYKMKKSHKHKEH